MDRNGDRFTVTFVWQGRQPPRLIADFTDWEENPVLLRQVTPGLWSCALDLPADTYAEYVYVDGDERQGGERLEDPFNTRRILNGMGKYNHFFRLPEGQPTPLVRRRRNVSHGRVTRYGVPTDQMAAGRQRNVYLYQPPVGSAYPLVAVWDGRDYYRRALLANIVDNLIAEERIRPIALAMVDNGGTARSIEYGCSETTLGFLMQEVLPLARSRLDLLDVGAHPGAYGVLGASMGGLMALFTGLRIPGIFGHVLSQSGAFSLGDYDSLVFDLVQHTPPRALKIWLDVGQYDMRSLLGANQRLFPLLKSRGYQAAYHEYNAGHNYIAWRDDLWRGLEYLFPPLDSAR